MAKFNLLLLDAGVIIKLFEFEIWEAFLERCDVHLSKTIMEEALYYIDSNDEQKPIHLSDYKAKMTVHDVSVSQVQELKKIFGRVLLERLDAGEAELLAVVHNSPENYRICSADAVVYRVLPALSKGSQGISLEEVLTQIGLSRKVSWPYNKRFRETYTQRGFEEMLTGIILPN